MLISAAALQLKYFIVILSSQEDIKHQKAGPKLLEYKFIIY